MARDLKVALARNITESALARFLHVTHREEQRLNRSVPGPVLRNMLRTYCTGNPAQETLKRMVRAMVEVTYLREDRKDMMINLVGYFLDTEGINFYHSILRLEPKVPDRVTIKEIRALCKEESKKRPPVTIGSMLKFKKPSPPMPEELHQQAIAAARQHVETAQQILAGLKAQIAALDNNLSKRRHQGVRSSAQMIERIKMRIIILQRRESEEALRLREVQQRYSEILERRS